jgi:hypothetical protein
MLMFGAEKMPKAATQVAILNIPSVTLNRNIAVVFGVSIGLLHFRRMGLSARHRHCTEERTPLLKLGELGRIEVLCLWSKIFERGGDGRAALGV